MTDRDHFAAAALTGLLAQGDDGSFSEESYARGAYRWADAMLRERSRSGKNSSGGTESAAKCTERDSANHDAAPAARANAESVAPQPTAGDRAGNPPSHSGTGDTPATHATHGEGSVRREGTQEPVAWAVRYRHGDTGIVDLCRTLADCRAKWSNRTTDYWLYEPLYRHPPCQDFSQKNLTLTDAERDDICVWLAECLRQASTATEGCNEELAERWTGRAKRAAAMIERLGGEG